MGIESFTTAMQSLGREPGLTVRQIAPGVPEYRVAMGPFPARIRVGFDLDPDSGLRPEVVLDVVVGELADRWAVMAAWGEVPRTGMVEHGLPQPLPVPDLTFSQGPRQSVEVAYRVPLDTFDTRQGLILLHASAAYASFMARELVAYLPLATAASLADHRIALGRPVPMPNDILASEIDHGRVAWAA